MAAAAAAAAVAWAADPSASNVSDPAFRGLDVNRDGYVSRAEARKLRQFEKAFAEADENRDGRLDEDEFLKAQSIHQRMRAQKFLEDSLITAKVKAALLKDREVSALDVKVQTYHGTVLLSGFVDDERQARRAMEIASGVRGVVAVKNSLIVKG